MLAVHFYGSLPGSLVENTPRGGWAGALTMTGFSPAYVNFIDVVGTADLFIDSRFDRSTGTVSLFNIAAPDYESFSRTGTSPVLNFQLRLFFNDGTQGLSDTNYTVNIGNVDDTPPTALAFATGGGVAPGAIGATIGTLAVTDPDSNGPFRFTIDPTDAWQYEVVGTTLKLRDGMTVSISDGPYRALNIEVSDGHQSAAFRLDIRVESPAGSGEQSVLDVLDPWEVKSGFSWKNADTVWATHGAWELDRIEYYGDTLIDVVLKDGNHVWLPGSVQRLQLFNGTLDMRQHGSADNINSAYLTALGRPADRFGVGPAVDSMDAGIFGVKALLGYLLNSAEFAGRYGSPNNDQFVRLMYRNTEGGTPYEPGVLGWKAQLDHGMSRLDVAYSFASWQVAINNADELHPHGWWLERPYGVHLGAIYESVLGRHANQPEFDSWMKLLEPGYVRLDYAAVLIARSEEGQARFAGFTDDAFVRAAYLQSMGHEIDSSSLAFWMNGLSHHTFGRDIVVATMALSDEKIGQLTLLPPGEPFFS